MRTAQVKVSLHIWAVSSEPMLLVHVSGRPRGNFSERTTFSVHAQPLSKVMTLLRGWACTLRDWFYEKSGEPLYHILLNISLSILSAGNLAYPNIIGEESSLVLLQISTMLWIMGLIVSSCTFIHHNLVYLPISFSMYFCLYLTWQMLWMLKIVKVSRLNKKHPHTKRKIILAASTLQEMKSCKPIWNTITGNNCMIQNLQNPGKPEQIDPMGDKTGAGISAELLVHFLLHTQVMSG